jgi:hypothetical protein
VLPSQRIGAINNRAEKIGVHDIFNIGLSLTKQFCGGMETLSCEHFTPTKALNLALVALALIGQNCDV